MRPSGLLSMTCCVILSLGPAAAAQEEALSDRKATFGGAVAPATLPAGAVAFYGHVGLPEIGGGFRQGFGLLEVEVRGRFHYLQLAGAVEALLKLRAFERDAFALAPYLGVGLGLNSGSRYFDTDNFPYFAVRPLAGVAASYRVSEILRALALIEVPYDLALVPAGGGGQLDALFGGGIELYLGDDLSALVMGRIGLDLLLPPASASPISRFGYEVRIGLGYRLF